MTEIPVKSSKTMRKQEPKRSHSITNPQPSSSKKQNRKNVNPKRFAKQSQDFGSSNSWICKNAACRAVLPMDEAFCKRCSCCLCHSFDDNKDPNLWLVCASESGADEDCCGSSCHIECALQNNKVGVVDLGQLMQLDGSYCCASCGKVTGILRTWRKQLIIAKDARRVDALCYRINLSYRLLDGTKQFGQLHEIVKEAKTKLEAETGLVNGTSEEMARGLVSRLSVASEVQKLCSLGIEKADEWLADSSDANTVSRGSLPAACKFIFEEVTSSRVVIVLIELTAAVSNDLKGYKLWYHKTRDENPTKEPICVFQKTQRRISISNLQPCTEYTFRIVSYTESGDLGHSEVKCFTKSAEIIQGSAYPTVNKKEKANSQERQKSGCSEFQVRELGKFLHCVGALNTKIEKCCGDNLASGSREIDLNVVTVPDLNEELTPPLDSSRDEEDNGQEGNDENIVRSNGNGDSQLWGRVPAGEVVAVDSPGVGSRRKRAGNLNVETTHESNETLMNNGSNVSGTLEENFEYCVKTIRWLERQGYINQEFRLKLLTWFSLRSTEQERRVVHTFIHALVDDPSSLAGQLVDAFSDIVSSKRPKKGF